MADVNNQASRNLEANENVTATSTPQAFQDFAANLWSGPPSRAAESAGGTRFDLAAFRGVQPAYAPIPEIPGVLTKLDGVTNAPRTEVTVDAHVAKMLPDNNNPRNGLSHEQFIIEMADGTDVFVAHDLNYAPRVPLKVGEEVEIKGEWIPQPQNKFGVDTIGVLHWTHESEDEHKHPSGYIEADGVKYSSK